MRNEPLVIGVVGIPTDRVIEALLHLPRRHQEHILLLAPSKTLDAGLATIEHVEPPKPLDIQRAFVNIGLHDDTRNKLGVARRLRAT